MKTATMAVTPAEDQKDLAKYTRETEEFILAHPEYFYCELNQQAIIGYMTSHDLDWTRENLAKTYTNLWKQKRIVPSGAQLNAMSGDEIKQWAEKIGVPKYDLYGRIAGYDWPCEIKPNTGYVDDNYRIPKAELRPINYDTDQSLRGYKPSKREFHSWSADKLTSWMWANELTSIPDYLR